MGSSYAPTRAAVARGRTTGMPREGLLGHGPQDRLVVSFFFSMCFVLFLFLNKSDYFWIFFHNVKICKNNCSKSEQILNSNRFEIGTTF
jgi:hypothetical protein